MDRQRLPNIQLCAQGAGRCVCSEAAETHRSARGHCVRPNKRGDAFGAVTATLTQTQERCQIQTWTFPFVRLSRAALSADLLLFPVLHQRSKAAAPALFDTHPYICSYVFAQRTLPWSESTHGQRDGAEHGDGASEELQALPGATACQSLPASVLPPSSLLIETNETHMWNFRTEATESPSEPLSSDVFLRFHLRTAFQAHLTRSLGFEFFLCTEENTLFAQIHHIKAKSQEKTTIKLQTSLWFCPDDHTIRRFKLLSRRWAVFSETGSFNWGLRWLQSYSLGNERVHNTESSFQATPIFF